LLGGNVITGVEMRREAGRLKLTVRTSNGVAPTTLHLKSPPRIALDFPGARWEEGLTLPSGVGEVTRLRNGYFQPPANPDAVAARLVLELKTPLTKIVELRMAETNVIASVGRGGPQMAKGMIPRTGAQRVQVGVQRRGKPRQMASRGGLNGSFNTDDPGQVTRILSPRLGNALAGKIICVDAGHGGHSKGAAGLQHLEKDICLKISRELQQELEARGARVVMTRSDDTFVSLAGRCQIANGAEADAFISIHLNSSPRRNSATGTETFWYTSHSFPLAQALHARMVGTVGKLDRGVRHRRLYVCRAVTMPSVLLEVAFINNENDEQLLASSQLHQNLAVSLAEGVVDFFRQR
jgi:N-acetylmuramoyl-L-alanine amidase